MDYDILNLLKEHPYVPGVLITLVLFWIAKKQATRKSNVEHQKAAVIELVSDIHKSKFTLLFGEFEVLPSTGATHVAHGNGKLTLFLVREFNSKVDHSHFEDSPVFFDRGSNMIISIDEHISNPSLPKKIKNILRKFQNTYFDSFNVNNQQTDFDYVSIQSNRLEDIPPFFKVNQDTPFKLGNAIAFQSYLSFQNCCAELEKNVVSWLNRNKVDLAIENEFHP